MTREIEVKGHSGCPIEIVRENNDLFIYKSCYDISYLDRLIIQAGKQQEAGKLEYQHIRIPEIYDVVHDDSHVTIKMEYVYSRNFIEYFESAGFEQVDFFIKALILFVEKELQASPLQLVQTSITLNKFEDVKNKILSNPMLADDEEILHILDKADKHFTEFAKNKTIKIPLGRCHGDLTFSNILFNGNNYYLIDFLDSFIESPLLDIVKIRQDSHHLWSQLMYIKTFDSLRLKIISEKIDDRINAYFSRYEWYRHYYLIFQILNLLRILQYAKEDKVIVFLKKELRKLLEPDCEVAQNETTPRNYSDHFSLIVPAAGDDDSHPGVMPYIFSIDGSGIMLCIRSIQGLNYDVFDDIYFTVLRKHVERFCLDEMMLLQFKRLGMKNAHLVILDNPTTSQSETIYETVKKESICGSIFIKDADGLFKTEIRKENSVAVFPLEELNMVDPQHKSYVSVDDMYYITNIIEKRIISHFFNAGGVCFEDVTDFLNYYSKLNMMHKHLCMSHIIYAMLIDKHKFRPLLTKEYVDWGNEQLLEFHTKK